MNQHRSRLLLIGLTLMVLGGCMNNPQKASSKVPTDFVKQTDSSAVMAQLSAMPDSDALIVRFGSGSTALNERAMRAIDKLIASQTPGIVAVMGTAGTDRYKDLGDARSRALAQYFYDNGVDSIMMEYQPKAAGKRGLIWPLSASVGERVKLNAPARLIQAPPMTAQAASL